jgi:hypothetical protein
MASAISHHRSSDGIDCSSSSVQKHSGRIIGCHPQFDVIQEELLVYTSLVSFRPHHQDKTTHCNNNQTNPHLDMRDCPIPDRSHEKDSQMYPVLCWDCSYL